MYARPGDHHIGVVEESWSLSGVPKNLGDIQTSQTASAHTDNPLRFELADGFVDNPGMVSVC
jgi:hypothetical protein